MDSIICVAVMTNLSAAVANLIMRFCSAGTAALPTSTARSPLATIIPSEAAIMPSNTPGSIASARSILAIKRTSCPFFEVCELASSRANSISCAFFGKLMAI